MSVIAVKKQVACKNHLGVGKSSDIYYLVVRMKDDAGNAYQDQSYSGIGITVWAVQGNAHVE